MQRRQFSREFKLDARQGKEDQSSVHGGGPDRVSALLDARATPELACVQAELGARLSFREVARVLRLLLPSGSAVNHTAVRRRLAETADRVQARDDASPHWSAPMKLVRVEC
jgi:hypothetical protein